jgi:hypothetical protein
MQSLRRSQLNTSAIQDGQATGLSVGKVIRGFSQPYVRGEYQEIAPLRFCQKFVIAVFHLGEVILVAALMAISSSNQSIMATGYLMVSMILACFLAVNGGSIELLKKKRVCLCTVMAMSVALFIAKTALALLKSVTSNEQRA